MVKNFSESLFDGFPFSKLISSKDLDIFINKGVVAVDAQRKVIFWNNAAEKIFGLKKEEIVGKSINLIIPKFEENSTNDAVKKATESKKEVNIKTQRKKKNNNLITVRLKLKPLFDKKLLGFLEVYDDITLQEKASDDLKNQIKKFRLLLENMNDGFYIIGKSGNLIDGNQNAQDLTGYHDKKELFSKSMLKVIAKESHVLVLRKTIESNISKKPQSYEIKIRRKDGKIIPVWLKSSPILNKKGQVVGHQGIMRDLTDIKMAQRELDFFKKIVENTNDSIVVTDSDGIISYVNTAESESLGYEKEDLIGKSVTFFGKDDDEEIKAQEEIVKKMQKNKKWTGITKKYSKNGNAIWYSTIVFSLKDPANIEKWVGISRNISKEEDYRLQLEEKLSDLKKFNRVAVGRELKMIELKQKIIKLESQIKRLKLK